MITNEKMALNLMMRETLGMKVKEPGMGEEMFRAIMASRMNGNAKYTGPEKYRFLTPRQKKRAIALDIVE